MKQYVVGLAGSHSVGKTCILQGIKNLGLPVDTSQLPRAAQAALGWTDLKPAQESQKNMWELQDAILDSLQERDRRINDTKIVTLVDRTPADLWGYTKLWISRIGEKNVDMYRAEKYQHRCLDLSYHYRYMIIVPIRDEIPFVAEANRGDEESRVFLADAVNDFITSGRFRHTVLQPVNLDERVAEVNMCLNPCICY